MQTTILITGTKAGIGRGLLEAYLSRPDSTAIAAIRDSPDSAAAEALRAIPRATGSKLIVTTYDAAAATSAKDMVVSLQSKHGITSLDIVVANAGVLKSHHAALEVTPDEMKEHYQVNTLGPLLLYQATAALLNASTKTPKFFIISSALGSNGLMDSYAWSLIAYASSKAAVNFIAGKIHREEKRIVVVPMQPGWVQTEMGHRAADFVGKSRDDVPVKIDESIAGLLKVFDKADKEGYSGRFWNQKDEEIPW